MDLDCLESVNYGSSWGTVEFCAGMVVDRGLKRKSKDFSSDLGKLCSAELIDRPIDHGKPKAYTESM